MTFSLARYSTVVATRSGPPAASSGIVAEAAEPDDSEPDNSTRLARVSAVPVQRTARNWFRGLSWPEVMPRSIPAEESRAQREGRNAQCQMSVVRA